MSRILVFDRNGKMLAEIEAICTRSWLLSKVGKASFTLSTRDPKCKREYLEFGNLVYIEHEKLPPWAGVIDTPRNWMPGSVKVNAYSGEQLLSYRTGPLNITLKGSAAPILSRILELSQKEEPLPIINGDIEDTGESRQETLNLTILLEVCQRLVKMAGGIFYFSPVLKNNILQFEFSYGSVFGHDTGFPLVEGHNLKLSSQPLIEQGTIINDLVGFGDGASWASKPTKRVIDENSIAQYGRRQGGKNFSGNAESGTLLSNTEQYITDNAFPIQILDLQVLDVGNAWNWMKLGNSFPVMLHSAGFSGSGFGYSGNAMIKGMEFNEVEQTVRVIFDSHEG